MAQACLSIEEATKRIHVYAREQWRSLELAYTKHAREHIRKRGIIISDIKHILAHGYIDEEPEESTRPGYCKYRICSKSPNSGNREICLVVIPDPDKPAVKIITAMWKDL